MCSEYEAPQREMFVERFGLEMPEFPVADMFSGRTGVYVRRPAESDSGDEAVAPLQPQLGRWGLVPRETKADRLPDQLKLSTYNARSERWQGHFLSVQRGVTPNVASCQQGPSTSRTGALASP